MKVRIGKSWYTVPQVQPTREQCAIESLTKRVESLERAR